MTHEIDSFPKNVLILEDDSYLLRTISLGLEQRGFTVFGLPSGVGAEEVILRNSIDAVVTDLYMPDREGIETTRSIVRAFPKIPVVVLTGSILEPVAATLGARALLSKPVRISILVQTIVASQKLHNLIEAAPPLYCHN